MNSIEKTDFIYDNLTTKFKCTKPNTTEHLSPQPTQIEAQNPNHNGQLTSKIGINTN